MTKRDKITVEDIIGIVHTDETTNSVEEVRKLRGRENITEKRFTGEFDKQYSGVHDNGEQLTNFEVVDLLNTLSEDNAYLEKRFKEEEWHYNHIDEDRDVWKHKCQELKKENEELKDKYNEQSVQYEGLEEQVERLLDFKDNVFNLINAKIKHYEHKPFSAPVGQPMSVNFDADVDRLARLSELQDLEKELQE